MLTRLKFNHVFVNISMDNGCVLSLRNGLLEGVVVFIWSFDVISDFS